MFRASRIMSLAVLLTLSQAAAQQTVYVNGTTGNDAWSGLCAEWDGGTCGPKATIQAGIDGAVAGDEVLIADGVYRGLAIRTSISAARRSQYVRPATTRSRASSIASSKAAASTSTAERWQVRSSRASRYLTETAPPAAACLAKNPARR